MESLVRYWKVRNQCPDAAMMMGIGNVTELTDVDSAGLNVFLTGICAELRIQSVLTTEVIHWARSSVKEIDLARRLMFHAVRNRMVPKYLEPDLITLRDDRIHQLGPETLAELQATIKDPNWRIFAEHGEIYALNHENYLKDSEPFRLFEQMGIDDPSHAFYLGYEMAKAKTALSLGKWYRQDQALNWGHLTEEEPSHWDGKKTTNSSDHRNQNQKK
jgi:dihydropteroate synthase